MRAQSPLDLSLSVLTLGELEKGVSRMAPSARRTQLTRWILEDLPKLFPGRLLSVDGAVASRWGRLDGAGFREGRALPVIDGLVLATADVAGLTLATRNVADCARRGVPVLNPWTGERFSD